ncbi:hypothetical protein CEB3_c41200 [Peptococcaceae bacterium CEB3]|nr:hypothetical protein CEB3_c41200 [Peptococcaceae bacterium CEB3]
MTTLTSVTIPAWWALAALAIMILIMWIPTARLANKLKKFQAAHKALLISLSGVNLDELLNEYSTKAETLESNMKDTRLRLARAEERQRSGMDKAALVRFNAFPNMGSDLSFSLALLNEEGSGLVLSSINSRDESRVYAKPLVQGESRYPLIGEEREAIAKALGTTAR